MKWLREWWRELFGQTCPRCDGDGEIVVKYRDDQIICRCPQCKGYGVLR